MTVEQITLLKRRNYLSRRVPPKNYLAKHKVLSQHITEGTTKAGLKCYFERDLTVEQLEEQIKELSNLITN